VTARAGTTLAALAIASAALAAAPVTATVESRGDTYRVQGAFRAPVAPEVAWTVLTDYDHIGAFVSSVLTSRVERRAEGALLLRQESVGGMLFVSHRVEVLLEVREDPGRSIRFRDVLARDFHRYQGEWQLVSDSAGVGLRYVLDADPKAPMPRVLGRAALGRSVRKLLGEVRAEMLRRAGPQAPVQAPRTAPQGDSRD